jgi:lipopolysaccharide transport system ATP-binding protein
MSDTVIRVENLSKKYIIGQQQKERYVSLRDVIANRVKSLGQQFRYPKQQVLKPEHEDFWALKDVSFEAKQGDRIGIIGRNGAGKSTLLKILSRVTEPTQGRISIKGRVASLLEVGTGFHPELTGRENIYLNGAILGMDRAEIEKNFDAIVAFAEIEKFLDTAVKRYSSGMYVRLAFAVAAHLEPEILIVDEVLAVGDAQFQKKCLGKIENISKEGRTILFVSHNMAAIKALCQRGVLLDSGSLIMDGDIEKTLDRYNQTSIENKSTCYQSSITSNSPYFQKIRVYQHNKNSNPFYIDEPIYIDCDIETANIENLVVSLVIRNSLGIWVHHSSDEFSSRNGSNRKCKLPPHALSSGNYSVDLYLGVRNYDLYEKIEDAISFAVVFSDMTHIHTSAQDWKGICGPALLIWS